MIRQLPFEIYTDRQNTRFPVPLLRGFVRNLDFVAEHLTSNRSSGEQWNYRIRCTDPMLDFARPLHSHEQVPVHKDFVAVAE